jgi:hypothetical protein
MANLLITGGAGFIGTNFVHYWSKQHPDDRSSCSTRSLMPATARTSTACRSPSWRATSATPTGRPAAARARDRHDRALRGREPCRPLDRGAGRLHRHQRQRHPQPAESRPRRVARQRQRPAAPLPPHLHRRGVWQPRARRSGILRDHALRAQLALRGVEGGERSPGPRLHRTYGLQTSITNPARTITGPTNIRKS